MSDLNRLIWISWLKQVNENHMLSFMSLKKIMKSDIKATLFFSFLWFYCTNFCGARLLRHHLNKLPVCCMPVSQYHMPKHEHWSFCVIRWWIPVYAGRSWPIISYSLVLRLIVFRWLCYWDTLSLPCHIKYLWWLKHLQFDSTCMW